MEQKNKVSCITFWMRERPAAPWGLKTWCLTTEEQGVAGSGAPRPVRRRRLGAQRRGAHRRRNKVLRGAEHHVPYTGDALGPKDVVLVDEGIRFCGERSTTPHTPATLWTQKTWCLTMKEQGFAGSGAPRPVRRRPGNSKPLARARRRSPRRQSLYLSRRPHHSAEPRPAAGGLSGRQPPTKKGPTHSRSSYFSYSA